MSSTKLWEKSYPPELHNYELDEQLLSGNVADFAIRGALEYGNKPAFSIALPTGMSATISYRELDKLSDAFAYYLANELGLKEGEVVAIQLPNSLHYPIAVMGAWKAGLIVTNVNPLYTPHELEHQLTDSRAKVLVGCDLFLATAEPVVKKLGLQLVVTSLGDFFPAILGWLIRRKLSAQTTQPSMPHHSFRQALKLGRGRPLQRRTHAVALYQYTGGTTGRSKGAVLTHRNLQAVIQMADSLLTGYGLELEAGDIILTALPMYHIFAFNFNGLLFMRRGGHNLLIPNPRPLDNMRAALKKFPVTWMTGVDTLYAGLLAQDWFVSNPPKLKLAVSGGTALRASTAEAWEKAVSTIVEGYGLTESSCFVCFNPPSRAKLGTVGVPLPGSEIRLVDDQGHDQPLGQRGELWVRGPHIIGQYLNRSDETANAIVDGWFATGDIAEMDEEGYLKIVDRKKDMILVSGFNVYPNEIEDVLALHPNIAEVAAIGVPDDSTGEAIRVFVAPRTAGLEADEVMRFCRERLTGYKVPKQIVIREALPKSTVGKILRAQLRDEK